LNGRTLENKTPDEFIERFVVRCVNGLKPPLSHLPRLSASRRTPLRQERIPFHARRVHVVVLHVTITPHGIRQIRQF
jgi:hypothetical protein